MGSYRDTVAPSTPTFDHGYTLEEVVSIKDKKSSIDTRNLADKPVTLHEFQTIVVPWNRIHRTEQFVLAAKKAASTAKKPRVAKPKRLTKKAIQERLNDIIFKKASGDSITLDDQTFLDEQTNLAGAL